MGNKAFVMALVSNTESASIIRQSKKKSAEKIPFSHFEEIAAHRVFEASRGPVQHPDHVALAGFVEFCWGWWCGSADITQKTHFKVRLLFKKLKRVLERQWLMVSVHLLSNETIRHQNTFVWSWTVNHQSGRNSEYWQQHGDHEVIVRTGPFREESYLREPLHQH